MKMVHKNFTGTITAHPSNIENMKRKGWTEEKQTNIKRTKKV